MKHILIVRLGCDHSFGNELLKVEWQHIQITQHPDTHTVLLQIVPTRDKTGMWRGRNTKKSMKKNRENQKTTSFKQGC